MTAAAAQRIRTWAFLLWIGLILVGSFIQVPEMKSIDRFHPDVIFHFAMYLGLAVLGILAYRWWALIPCAIVAMGTEIVQHFLPYREMSLVDFGTNLLGTAAGSAVWAVILLIQHDRRRLGQSMAERID